MTYLPNEDLGWSELAERFPTGLDLAASAREYGAFMRPRGVGSAECLLRLALIYGTTSLSLRGTATWAEAKGLAQLSDVALLGRLQGADAWLGNIVAALLSAALPPPGGVPKGKRRVRLVDATMIKAPGRAQPSWRLHADYDWARRRFVDLVLTDHHASESLQRFTPDRGDLVVADRYYAKARQLHHVIDCGGDVIVRRGITGCKLVHANGGKFDLKKTLGSVGADETLDLPVWVPAPPDGGGAPLRARLIIRHMGEHAERAQQRARRKAARAGQKAQPKRLEAAQYCMLLTSLDAHEASADDVLALYRLRWQIEIAFKRLKSLVGLADLQAKEPRLVRSCLYAKLILALLSEDILQDLLEFFPSEPLYRAAVDLAAPAHHPRNPAQPHHR